MASIDALSAPLTSKHSPGVMRNKQITDYLVDGETILTTYSETANEGTQHLNHDTSEQEDKEPDTRLDDGDGDHGTELDKSEADSPRLPDSEIVSQDLSEGENDALEFIQVDMPRTSRNSPLFFSNIEHTSPDGLAIVVPAVQRRWEYRVFAEEYTIRAVLQDLKDSAEVEYQVRFEDGHTTTVSQLNPTTPRLHIKYHYIGTTILDFSPHPFNWLL